MDHVVALHGKCSLKQKSEIKGIHLLRAEYLRKKLNLVNTVSKLTLDEPLLLHIMQSSFDHHVFDINILYIIIW